MNSDNLPEGCYPLEHGEIKQEGDFVEKRSGGWFRTTSAGFPVSRFTRVCRKIIPQHNPNPNYGSW